MTARRTLVVALAAALAALAAPTGALAYQEQDNQVVTSFDGTPIVYKTFFPDSASATSPVPIVLMTHGWGGSRQTSASGLLKKLLDDGYGAVTWDQRGFGQSGGQAEVDSIDFEARDVQALLDAVQGDPRVAKDSTGDPKVGMAGGSYAGGIQFVTAARDPRIDAITPTIAWHNLLESLSPDDVVKTGWDSLLYGAGLATSTASGLSPSNPAGTQTGNYDPALDQAFVEGTTLGQFSDQTKQFFLSRGPFDVLDRIHVPVFILQGTVDTLFPPTQGVENYEALKANGVPLKMAWFCGGHGVCNFDSGPAGYTDSLVLHWLDRYVKGDASVETGPTFEYVDEDGAWHGAADYPVPGTVTRSGQGSGVVTANGEPTAGGVVGTGATEGNTSLEIPVAVSDGDLLVGEPTLRITEHGTGTATDNPDKAVLFFQFVDKTTGKVLGNQITPKVMATDGASHDYTFKLEGLSYRVDPGHQIVLEVVGTSANYEPYRGAAVVSLDSVQVDVPARRGRNP